MTPPFERPGSPPRGAAGPPPRSRRRVVVVGSDAAVVALARRLRADPRAGLTVVGACVPDGLPHLVSEGIPVLGRPDDVVRVAHDVRADAVLAAGDEATSGTYVRELARRLRGSGRGVLVVPSDDEVCSAPLRLREVDGPHLLGPDRVAKAVADRLGAAVLLLLTAVVLLGITLAVRLDGPGGVLSRQRRLGQWGREFDVLRFRTTARDGSVTTVGRFLRRFALDELPELVNVLAGDMSLVGPRPQHLPDGAPESPPAAPWLPVKPGITGLWHLRGGRGDQDGPVELEYYRENWSLALDLRILVRSLHAALRGRGW